MSSLGRVWCYGEGEGCRSAVVVEVHNAREFSGSLVSGLRVLEEFMSLGVEQSLVEAMAAMEAMEA